MLLNLFFTASFRSPTSIFRSGTPLLDLAVHPTLSICWGTGYADDLKLLTPSVNTLKILATICVQYAKKFDVLFNGKKSLLIIYKCTKSQPPNPGIVINNVRVPRVDEVIL